MKLVSQYPQENDQGPQTPFYAQAKRLYSLVESSGMMSLHLLQSSILIAVYEVGHGIHPPAYLSAGNAARLGIVMGLHDRSNATQMFKRAETWTLREEERRTWWAALVLDR